MEKFRIICLDLAFQLNHVLLGFIEVPIEQNVKIWREGREELESNSNLHCITQKNHLFIHIENNVANAQLAIAFLTANSNILGREVGAVCRKIN